MKPARFCQLAASISLLLLTSCAVLRRDDAETIDEFAIDDPTAPEIVVPGSSASEPAAEVMPPVVQGEVEVAEMRIQVGRSTRTVKFRLLSDDAPKTTANFRKLANEGFYRGQAVHRAISGFLVQTGDPLTRDQSQRNEWGTGGPGYTIPAEIGLPHVRGAVAMARLRDSANPRRESNGSQFYFVLTELPELDNRYTVFGEVISGIEVLDEISRAVVDSNDSPMERFEIKSIEIRRVPARQAVTAADDVRQTPVGGRRASKGTADRGPLTRFLERYW